MSVTVVGGAGFVGLNVVEALAVRGAAVRVLDRTPLPVGARALLSGPVTALAGSVEDAVAVAAAIPERTTGVVYGAAITAGAEREARDPETILAVNLGGLVPVLRRAASVRARRLVLLSSAAAYGATGYRHPRLDETLPAEPEGLYAVTKFAGERVAARLGSLWGVDVRIVRLSGLYGPWERATGVRDTLSPLLQVMVAAETREPAILSREGSRDWLYAPDAAAGILTLLDAERPTHRLYNLSAGTVSTVLAFGQALAALRPGFVCRLAETGESPTIDLHGDADRAPLATARMADDLGWRARFGIAEAAAHLDAWRRRADWSGSCTAGAP